MNIKDLKYFLAVAELEHFGQAAEQCYVSQPTLSGQIKKLEESLGIQLLERANRRVILTEIGVQIAKSARRILSEVDNIHELAESSNEPLTGKFRIGAFPTLATYVFPKMVTQMKEIMPNLRPILIEEKTGVLLESLKRGDIDVALLALPIFDQSLVSQKLFDDEFFLAVPKDHELTQYERIDPKKLAKHKLLLLEEGHCMRDGALEICQMHGISEEQDFKATGLETLRQMVKANTGITIIPKIAIQEDKDISYIPFNEPAPSRTIGLVWRKTTTRQIVLEKLREILAH